MGSYSRPRAKTQTQTPPQPLRIVMGDSSCEVEPLAQARAFFSAENADAFADFLLSDIADDAHALMRLRRKLDRVRAVL